MSVDTPLITIGITCYNAADTIARAIESARGQDWANVEILVVDDCSSDNSCAVVEAFEDVRLIRHAENTGPGGARQSLVEAARGDYIAFFDDDDESAPARLRVQYERIIAYEAQAGTDLIACYASGRRVYPNGYSVAIAAIGRRDIVPRGEPVAERILCFGADQAGWCYGASPSCALMAKTDVFKRVGGFDPAFRRVEDLDFAVRLALAGGHFVGCEEMLFTQHATVAADKSHDKNLAAELQLAEKHKGYLDECGLYRYATYWPILRCCHFERDYVRFVGVFLKLWAAYPLRAIGHLWRTGPKRVVHELRIMRRRVG